MIKLAANAALMPRISFINEIANVCEATGADVVKVAEGVGLDKRIGKSFLRAGIGYGGSCFPKDSLALKQLAANSGYHFQLLNAVIEVNELQKRRVIAKLQRHLDSLSGKTVALLGLAFKANTDDMREAPSIVLAGRLLSEGAQVRGGQPSSFLGSAKVLSHLSTSEPWTMSMRPESLEVAVPSMRSAGGGRIVRRVSSGATGRAGNRPDRRGRPAQ